MGITDHNQEFIRNPNSDEAFRAIFEGLQDQVRAYIQANFPSELRRTRQVTEFLDDAFLTYQKKVASELGPWEEFDTKRLVGYLKQIARKKLAEATRYEAAIGRDPGRVDQFPTQELSNPESLSAYAEVERREESTLLCAELLNEKEERNKLINLMHFGMTKSAREIEEVFREANGGKRSVSDSTILRVISKTRARLTNLGIAHRDDGDE